MEENYKPNFPEVKLNKKSDEWLGRQYEMLTNIISVEDKNYTLLCPMGIKFGNGFAVIETRETPFEKSEIVFTQNPAQEVFVLSDKLKEKLHEWVKSESSDSEKIKDSNKQEEVDLDYGKFLRKSVEKYLTNLRKK